MPKTSATVKPTPADDLPPPDKSQTVEAGRLLFNLQELRILPGKIEVKCTMLKNGEGFDLIHQIVGGDGDLSKIMDQLLRKVHSRVEEVFGLGSHLPEEFLLKGGKAAQDEDNA